MRSSRILAVGLCALAASGCATKKHVSREVGEVNQKVDALSGEGERKKLLQAVETGAVRNERVEAARKLAGIGNLQTFERLVAVVQHRDFPNRDDEELDAVLGTVTKLGGVRAVRLLQELAERKTLLRLGRANTQRLSVAATNWLNELKKGRKA